MRLALAQYALGSEMEPNLVMALEWMRQARSRDAQLVLFPELCLSPFFPQYAGQDASPYVLTIDHEGVRQFQTACRELKLMASPNLYLQEGARRFDASLLIGADGQIQGVSKMVHIVQVPCFYEQRHRMLRRRAH